MRNGWFGGFLAVMLMMIGTAPGADEPPAEDARLEAFFRTYLDADLPRRTAVGDKARRPPL